MTSSRPRGLVDAPLRCSWVDGQAGRRGSNPLLRLRVNYSALLPANRGQSRCRGRSRRVRQSLVRHGNWYGQDVHRVPDCKEALQDRAQEEGSYTWRIETCCSTRSSPATSNRSTESSRRSRGASSILLAKCFSPRISNSLTRTSSTRTHLSPTSSLTRSSSTWSSSTSVIVEA